jgi:hypothetical protein
MTRLRLGLPENRGSIQGGAVNFLFGTASRLALRPTQSRIQRYRSGILGRGGGKGQGAMLGTHLHVMLKVEKDWSYNYTH